MHSHQREIAFRCMCWPCVWQQICAISWDFFTPVQHNHQYILGWPPLRLTAEYPSETQEYIQDEKSYWHPVPKCKCSCCECNTFALVRIHVQMFQAMSVKRYPLTNASIFYYTWCNFAFQSWHHKNDFQVENKCILSCQSHLHMNSHYSKCVAFDHGICI